MDMDFQGIPDPARINVEAIAARVAVLEKQVEELQNHAAKELPVGVSYSFTLRGIENPIRFTGGGSTQPPAIRKTQDDAGRKPFFKTMEKVPKTNEAGS